VDFVVTLKVRIAATPARTNEVTAALVSLVGPVRAQPGCVATRVLNVLDEDNAVAFEEEWRSQSDLEQHFRTPAFRTLLATMELASRQPSFEVDLLDKRLGFEFVEGVLGATEGEAVGGRREIPPEQ
jgi:quinol monooxygenase YgiN